MLVHFNGFSLTVTSPNDIGLVSVEEVGYNELGSPNRVVVEYTLFVDVGGHERVVGHYKPSEKEKAYSLVRVLARAMRSVLEAGNDFDVVEWVERPYDGNWRYIDEPEEE